MKTVERLVPVRAPTAARKVIERLQSRARHAGSDREGEALFRDPEKSGELVNLASIRAASSRALKRAAGDGLAIPYSLRHTFVTSFMVRLLAPRPASPFLRAVIEELARPDQNWNSPRLLEATSNPLQVDRLATWLGHSTQTLHQSYWHGAWWIISDRCYQAAIETPWSDVVIAALAGIDRSSITKRREKIRCSQEASLDDDELDPGIGDHAF